MRTAPMLALKATPITQTLFLDAATWPEQRVPCLHPTGQTGKV